MICVNNIQTAFLDSLNFVFQNGFEAADKDIFLETPILIKVENINKIDTKQELNNIKNFLEPIYPDFIYQYNFEREFYETELFSQIETVTQTIEQKLDSRKLFFNFWKKGDQNQETKSPCLTSIYFRQKLDKILDVQVSLRANNAVRISLINMLIFIEFAQSVAQKLDLRLGDYYHFANSYHIYQKDLELARQIISKN